MYERDSKEKLLQRMVNWSRATSPKLTDFRRGSVIRTIYESVALVVEGGSSKFYNALKSIIEKNIYSVIGFDKEQARPSTGEVTFGRTEPAEKAYVIPRGTEIVARANDYRPPITFRTVEESFLEVGYSSVKVPVVCTEAGELTNVLAGDINDFITKPTGIDTVTNAEDFLDGRDEETPEQQKNRFQDYMEANTRGTLQSIEFGARQAYLLDDVGMVQEQVLQALATEDIANRKGEVDLYIWNGTGNPSTALQDEIQKILLGYFDENGERVYGYKNGGTDVNIYPALVSSVKIRLTLTLQSWASEAYVKDRIGKEISALFRSLRIGQTLLFSDVMTWAKSVEGVLDLKVELSTDGGTTYSPENVTVDQNEINVLDSIVYV
jgi:uncharacterized phage protein gp47/JayE